MRSLKAIVAGSMFIIITLLLLQLVYVFLAVGYISLAADYPFLKNISGVFRYLIGIPVVVITMFVGGIITASIANVHTNAKVLFHSLAVALFTVGGTMYLALEKANLTMTGIVVVLIAVSSVMMGGFFWLKQFSKDPI